MLYSFTQKLSGSFFCLLISATMLAAGTNRDTINRRIPYGGPEGLIGTTAASPVDNPSDNVFHVRISQSLKGNEQLFLVYDLEGVQDHASVSRSINDQLSVGGYLVKKRRGWATQREPISAAWVKQGDNVIRFTIPEGAGYSYRVKNVRFEVGAAANGQLVVSQGTFYSNNKAYVKGFVRNSNKNISVRVGGREARVWKGAFEAIVENPGKEKEWTTTVTVLENNKLVAQKSIRFSQPVAADYNYEMSAHVSFTQKVVTKEASGTVLLKGASISIPKGALKNAAAISITSLRAIDIPALDAGMVNVTAGTAGYRFLPHGTSFLKEASLQIGYDAAKIPDGYTAADIKTYYFDEQTHHWVALPVDTVLEGNTMVIARTRHFTDMINAIIKVPESPEVQAYNSTSMKGIKAANPTAAVNLINPPSASNLGSASIGYPINIPAGRGGMQPQLSIAYNSSSGNGWLGLGWNLSIPSIGIDTRWGVPRYDHQKETETYAINGEQLSPVAHRGELVNRSTGDKQFFPRVEGAFNKIMRHGNSPSNYWWELTDKKGTRYFYGGDPDRNSNDPAYILTDNEGNIGHWALKEIRDLNGNFVRYHYAKVEDAGLARGTVKGYQLYIARITYTGHKGVEGKYSVLFTRDRQLNEARRSDVSIMATLGFKQVTADLLRKIEVQFENRNIRSYELKYGKGEFEKTLLDSISEFDAGGKLFNTHKFRYFNDVRKGNVLQPFLQTEAWNPQKDNLHGDFINPLSAFNDNASALSGTKSKDVSAGMAVAIGFNPDVSSKSLSVGGNFSYSQSASEGMLTLMDINGDGLADKIYIKDDMIRYRRNLGTTEFGPERSLVSAPRSFFNEKSKTISGGVEASGPRSLPVFVGAGISKTTSTTTTYITEVNGDLLPDIVVNGRVYFNHINKDGDPAFSLSSANTPSPIFQDGSIQPIGVDASELEQVIDQNPLHDIVRMWQAPYTGAVSITGNVALIQSNDPERAETPADGVRVAIQKKGSELWFKSINADDYSTHTPSGVSQVSVQKGDRIYFRVQSVYNGSYDQVLWEPVITYLNKDVTETDANNLPRFRFSLKDDFIVTALQEITMPIKGKLAVSGSFTKPVASDTVRLEIRKKIPVGNGNYFSSVIWTKTYLPDESLIEPITMTFDVEKEQVYSFHIIANTNVDWSRVRWNPYLNYEASYDPDYPNVKDANGKPLVEYYPVVYTTMLSKEVLATEPYKVPALVTKMKIKPAITFSGSILDVLKLNGTVVFTVKRNNELLAKQILPVQFGEVHQITEQEITVAKDEKLFFEYHISNPVLAAAAGNLHVNAANMGTIAAGLHTAYEEEKDLIYGPMFRHWGQFAYNGNRGRSGTPIDESLLKLSDAMKNQRPVPVDQNTNGEDLEQEEIYDPAKEIFIVLVPATISRTTGSAKEHVWIGYDNATYVAGVYLSSSRMGEDDITALIGDPNGGSGARAVNKVSTTFNRSYSVGGSVGPLGGGNTRSSGDMNIIADFMDMNGDRYPDIITKDKVQYTNARGGFSDRTFAHGIDGNHHTQTSSNGFSISGNYVMSKAEGTPSNPKKVTVSVGNGQSSAGISGNFGTGTSTTAFTWMDMNGDGLPDKVFQQGNLVALNLGYKLAPAEPWGFAAIQNAESKSMGAGLGVSIVNGSISAGVAFSRSDNNVAEALQDVNGDGLPDMVMKGSPLKVRLNTGTGFGAEILWSGATDINKSSSTSQSANLAFTAGIYIPLINIKIVVNPSTSIGAGVTRDLEKLNDMDGDGYPDYVSSSKDDNLSVARSSIGRTNLLLSVHRPMGALIVMDYKKMGNTYNMPNIVWTLSDVRIFDGYAGDGKDTLAYSYVYENGNYDRNEREFYGFEKVSTRTHNTADNSVYTVTVQTFNNFSYYEKGLVITEVLKTADGKKFTEKENQYQLRDIHTGTVLPDAFRKDDAGAAFVALIRTYQRFYEGQQAAGKSTQADYDYDNYGNMKSFTDFGDEGSEDDVRAVIEYRYLPGIYVMGAARSVIVTAGGKTLRRREAVIENNGDVSQIRQFIDADNVAVHDFIYDSYGNLEKETSPANAKGQRMVLDYEYDASVHTYVTRVSNSHGYHSTSTYDLRFGQVLSTKDLNGNEVTNTLDELGRLEKITGPYEKGSGAAYTIRFEYHPEAVVPWALTKHFDPANPRNDLETVTFTDGMGRVLQTKKDIALHQGAGVADKEAMVVSGKIIYDGLGRVSKAYYPVTENKGTPGIMNKNADLIQPTVTTYDVMNRTVSVTLPDGAITETAYGFERDNLGRLQFNTRVTDANGKQTERFADIKGRVTAVRKITDKGMIWTSFVYNPVSEQLQATDNLGNTTYSQYDWLGRKTSQQHPDAGLTTYGYDPAGNLISMVTANLRPDSASIFYEYDFNRLSSIIYPKHPENNVRYTYGAADARDNRVGKIILQEDASGAQEFFYGPLGETVKTIRTVVIPQHDPQTYVTEWTYDTWNRLTGMIYPDGEKLTYSYNAGGLLASMEGRKQSDQYIYVRQLGYDKFEQRVFLAYGNGTQTTYQYEPDRRRLKNMVARTAAGRAMMDNIYAYDQLNNILSLENNAPIPTNNLMGGSATYVFAYDDLYRLTDASGSFRRSNEEQRYSLQMAYNSVGSITRKVQMHDKKGGGNWIPQKKTTYDLQYSYETKQPHAPVHIDEQTYTYDANGNNTGWTHDKTGQRRKMLWDEENRLRAVYDNGALFHYVYDASGERVLKGQSIGQMIYVNGEPKGGSGGMGNYTIYVNPYLVLRSGGYTKHYFIERQRIVSKLGSGWDNNGKGPLKSAGDTIKYEDKHKQLVEGIVRNLKFLGADGQILTAGKSGKIPPGQVITAPGNNGPVKTTESFQYFYHPDHVGSTSYVTDASGEVYQHIEYMAFGENFVEEHSNTHRTPYLFNGKELDDETGLYYYGARYYDPRTSIWQSVDPLTYETPEESPYSAMGNNPLTNIDPNGESWEPFGEDGKAVSINDKEKIVGYRWVDYDTDEKGNKVARANTVETAYTFGINGMTTLTSENYQPQQTWQAYEDISTGNKSTDRKLATLHPDVQNQMKSFILKAKLRFGIDLRVTDGYRTIEEQDKLYAKGRTAPGEIVTKAKGGYSNHNFGLAIDVVPYENGKLNWNTKHWALIGRIGQSRGLEWGGTWKFVDKPHFQNLFGRTLRQIRALPKTADGFPKLK